ncbi:MAG TPA: hypothetical protein VFY59_10725 [Rubrobacter sp.]|nr:hypothetical protein [Rubrobacter sp.]
MKGARSGYWMALPALLAILALVAYPLAFTTYYPTGGPAWLLARSQRHHAFA